MFKLKWAFLVLYVFIFIAEFHGGETLKCIVCKSTDNDQCANAPKEIETSECDSTISTSSPATPTTTVTTSGTTPTTTPVPPTNATITPAPTTNATTTPAPTTNATTTLAPTTNATTTPAPTTNATTTLAPTTNATTTPAPTTNATTTPAPTTNATTTPAPSTNATTTPAPSTNATTAPVPPVNDTRGNNEAKPDSQKNQNIPQAIQINRRSRRQAGASVFADSDSQCYKIVYQAGDTEVVERGCTQTTCNALEAGKGDVSFCGVCNNEDGCNSSSMIITNITLILLLLGITFHCTQ